MYLFVLGQIISFFTSEITCYRHSSFKGLKTFLVQIEKEKKKTRKREKPQKENTQTQRRGRATTTTRLY